MNKLKTESNIPSRSGFVLLASGLVFLYLIYFYFDALSQMVHAWQRPEYSHGFFIPLISLYLIWQRRHEISQVSSHGAWWGVGLLLFASFIFILGKLSTVYILMQYAFVLSLYGLVLSLFGLRAFKIMLVPLIFLLFMIPLPNFLYQGLSANLQLISSEIGVAIIRLFNISVFLEGNIIDLGSYKLQVVEACSGLKYLFSLTSISFLCAYLFSGAFWKRLLIFLSAIPITIFMNSFRIAVTGVLVEHWGIEHADGFLHEFEGLVIFGFAMLLLLLFMAALARFGKPSKKLFEVFAVNKSGNTKIHFKQLMPKLNSAFYASIALVLLVSLTVYSLTIRESQSFERKRFFSFPEKIDVWTGNKTLLGQEYLKALKLDDYILANYKHPGGKNVNFYLAWYASQKAGRSAHSPRSCLPGSGWKITQLTQKKLSMQSIGMSPVKVNRTIIQSGETKQLVYYWFDQRGRNLTNEYLVKWYIFWDSIVTNRSDGALVRLTTLIYPNEKISEADERLLTFSKKIMPLLSEYVPN